MYFLILKKMTFGSKNKKIFKKNKQTKNKQKKSLLHRVQFSEENALEDQIQF